MDRIIETSNRLYQQLGPSHNECVYQKALVIELYNLGAKSVEFEKHVPVFFKDSNGTMHTIGDERIDILATFDNAEIILIELKAIARNRLSGHVEQVSKYKRALAHLNVFPTVCMLINFPQQPQPGTDIESLVVVG